VRKKKKVVKKKIAKLVKKVKKTIASIVNPSISKILHNKFGKNAKTVNTVYATKNYGQFGFFKENRIVRPSHVLRLADSMKKRYLPRSIIVTLQNGKLMIVDGQHGFKAASSLGLPIYFVVFEGLTIEDVITLNARMSQWLPADYLNTYCVRGFPHYLTLNKFRNDDLVGEVSIADCISILIGINPGGSFYVSRKQHVGGTRRSVMDKFRDGDFVVDPENLKAGRVFAAHLLDFEGHLKYWKNRNFIHAVKLLYSHPEYNTGQMIDKLRKYKGDMPTATTNVIAFGKMLQQVYNKNQPKIKGARIHLPWEEIEESGTGLITDDGGDPD
jgi:hypothetical protein